MGEDQLNRFTDLVRQQLQLLGEDPERDGLEKTPMRVAKAYEFLTRGYWQDPKKVLNDALFEHVKNGLVEPRDAYIKAVDKANFETMLTRGGFRL